MTKDAEGREKTAGGGAKPSAGDRDARLKAALKANLARRKAQAKARTGAGGPNDARSPDEN